MAIAETIKIEVGYEDDGTIIFVDIDKENIALVRKALAYLHKQEQEEKQKARKLASTCRNCQFSQQRDRYDGKTEIDVNTYPRCLFQRGYEQAEKDLGWHSVKECLPEMDEKVIVLKDILVADGLKVGFGQIAFGHIVDVERCIDYNGWNIPGVKYWMPFPKIPNND